MKPPEQGFIREVATLWSGFTWRHWTQSPGATMVLVTILALGVGVFFSIRLANRAAVSGFTLFTETLNGASDLLVVAPSSRLPTSALREIRDLLGDLPVSLFPVLESTATEPSQNDDADGFNAEQFHLVGVDLLALPNLVFLNADPYQPPVDFTDSNPTPSEPTAWRLESSHTHQVFITEDLASRRNLATGSPLPLIVQDQPLTFEIAGVLPETEFSANKPANLLVMDLPQLQTLLGQPESIDRIELRIPTGSLYQTWLEQTRKRLEQSNSPIWELETPEQQRQTGATMTRAFRLNLTVLSGLALLVGIYLILQALEAAVIKRRQEIGTLRSLGVRPSAILAAWLVESLVLGLLGSALGLLIGYFGAQAAVGAIAKTVNSLYYSNTTTAAGWNHSEAALAMGLGLVASLIAGWLPARDAAATPPAQVLARGNRSQGLSFLAKPLLGLALLLSAWLASECPPLSLGPGIQFPLAGYASALLWVLGSSIVGSTLFRPLAKLIQSIGANSAPATYAASQLRSPSGRHRLTAAGLLVAVGMAAGMSILIRSFESTMTTWIAQALKADLYIAVQGIGNISSANRIRPEVWRKITQTPGVAEAEIGQMYPITFRGASTHLVGASFGERAGWRSMVWVQAPETPFAQLDHQAPVTPALINESFHQRFQVNVGEELSLPTPQGLVKARIVGIFADYGNERGSLVVSRQRLAQWYQDDSALNVALHVTPNTDPDSVRRTLMAEHPGLVVRTNRNLREEVMVVFHETFSVTHALKWIGVGVAMIGLGLGLTSILLERRSELRVLKELGLRQSEIAYTVSLEGFGLTLVGVIGGIALSIALGHLLIYVINYQSFGWTLAFRIPTGDLLRLAVGVLVTGSLVAFVVGYRSAKLPSDKEE